MRGEGGLDCSTVNEEHSGDISSQMVRLISYTACKAEFSDRESCRKP